MRSVLVSIWVWCAIGLLLVLWVPLTALVWLFDRDPARYWTGYFLRLLGRSFTYVNPFWDITVDGAFPDDPRRPYICVSNHLSQGDPPIISWVPWEMKWVAKAELFRLPPAGWLLQMSGDIPVDRRDRESRANVLKRARHYLERRCSVMFFPEGTRSRDGKVHRFANGAFRLAMKENVPVLPIAIDGTQEALPKHSIWFDPAPAPIRVRVLPPVHPSSVDAGDTTAFQRMVRARIVEQIADWRGVAPAAVDTLQAGPDDADSNVSGPGEASVNLGAHSGSSEPSD